MDHSDKIIAEGLTFDDVLLIPQHSDVLPANVSLKTKLTPTITLNVPIVSAAMDTVTEAEMAIALARQGGIGFIHKNMSVECQAAQVDKVKRNESGMISDPITLDPNATIAHAEELLARYKISGLPVVDKNGILKGIITNRDLKYLVGQGDTLVKEVMTRRNLVTAPQGTSLAEAKRILWQHRIEKLPIVDEHGHLKGLITSKDIDNAVNYPNACKDEQGRLRVGAAVGVSANTPERVDALVKAGVDVIVVDSAHGHSQGILNTVAKIRAAHPNLQIIAGNIVTAEAAFDWDDVGSWTSMRNQILPEKNNNVVRGLLAGLDTSDCIIIGNSNHLIATVDVKDLVIVATEDATLVCNAKSAQRIKELVKLIAGQPDLAKFV